ncbi:MAG: hypothetical protein IJA94_06355 [Bacilli bacterium]|nr:hypothetical protein [Bacilli bacterium]
MKIEVIQIDNEEKNEFEIRYNGNLQYRAKLPFISIREPFNLEKLRKIKIINLKGEEIYTTDYKYVENLQEEFIPLKYLVTGSQKFNQLLFTSESNIIKIYYEVKGIFDSRYVIEINDKKYFCYSIEDGYVRHFPIYDGELQVGEALKSNVLTDAKDEYWCYLKKGYEFLSYGIVSLLLYLDRSEYSSSYLVTKSYNLSKKSSYNKNNKFYDQEWVIKNFGYEFYKKVNNDVNFVKQKFKNPMKTWKEQWNSLALKEKKLLKFVLLAPWVMIAIVGSIIIIFFVFFLCINKL